MFMSSAVLQGFGSTFKLEYTPPTNMFCSSPGPDQDFKQDPDQVPGQILHQVPDHILVQVSDQVLSCSFYKYLAFYISFSLFLSLCLFSLSILLSLYFSLIMRYFMMLLVNGLILWPYNSDR